MKSALTKIVSALKQLKIQSYAYWLYTKPDGKDTRIHDLKSLINTLVFYSVLTKSEYIQLCKIAPLCANVTLLPDPNFEEEFLGNTWDELAEHRIIQIVDALNALIDE